MRRTRPLVVPHRRLPQLRDHPHRRQSRIQPRPGRTPRRRKRTHLLLTATRRRGARSLIGWPCRRRSPWVGDLARLALGREPLAAEARIACQLALKPAGRVEFVGGVLAGEFDLGEYEAGQVPGVDVDLDSEIAVWDEVSPLLEAAAAGQSPEPLEAVRGEL